MERLSVLPHNNAGRRGGVTNRCGPCAVFSYTCCLSGVLKDSCALHSLVSAFFFSPKFVFFVFALNCVARCFQLDPGITLGNNAPIKNKMNLNLFVILTYWLKISTDGQLYRTITLKIETAGNHKSAQISK